MYDFDTTFFNTFLIYTKQFLVNFLSNVLLALVDSYHASDLVSLMLSSFEVLILIVMFACFYYLDLRKTFYGSPSDRTLSIHALVSLIFEFLRICGSLSLMFLVTCDSIGLKYKREPFAGQIFRDCRPHLVAAYISVDEGVRIFWSQFKASDLHAKVKTLLDYLTRHVTKRHLQLIFNTVLSLGFGWQVLRLVRLARKIKQSLSQESAPQNEMERKMRTGTIENPDFRDKSSENVWV